MSFHNPSAQLVDRLHQALQTNQAPTHPPEATNPVNYTLAAGQAGKSRKRPKHLILQFPGVGEWSDETISTASTESKPSMIGDSDSSIEPLSGDTNGTAFSDGDFGNRTMNLTMNEAEDAMLMVEAWLNFQFDRYQKKRNSALS